MRHAILALIMATAIATAGCAAVASALPVVLEVTTTAITVLDQIETWADARADDELRERIDEKLVAARGALVVLQRAARGGRSLDDGDVDQAFADFESAYRELLDLVDPIGVRPVAGRPPPDAPLGVSDSVLYVPTAEALVGEAGS